LRAVWNRGVASGQLRTDIDADVAIDVMIGPVLYRHLLGHAPLDEAAADAIVDTAMRGVATRD
jgi:hypothetical protein